MYRAPSLCRGSGEGGNQKLIENYGKSPNRKPLILQTYIYSRYYAFEWRERDIDHTNVLISVRFGTGISEQVLVQILYRVVHLKPLKMIFQMSSYSCYSDQGEVLNQRSNHPCYGSITLNITFEQSIVCITP